MSYEQFILSFIFTYVVTFTSILYVDTWIPMAIEHPFISFRAEKQTHTFSQF